MINSLLIVVTLDIMIFIDFVLLLIKLFWFKPFRELGLTSLCGRCPSTSGCGFIDH